MRLCAALRWPGRGVLFPPEGWTVADDGAHCTFLSPGHEGRYAGQQPFDFTLKWHIDRAERRRRRQVQSRTASVFFCWFADPLPQLAVAPRPSQCQCADSDWCRLLFDGAIHCDIPAAIAHHRRSAGQTNARNMRWVRAPRFSRRLIFFCSGERIRKWGRSRWRATEKARAWFTNKSAALLLSVFFSISFGNRKKKTGVAARWYRRGGKLSATRRQLSPDEGKEEENHCSRSFHRPTTIDRFAGSRRRWWAAVPPHRQHRHRAALRNKEKERSGNSNSNSNSNSSGTIRA